MSQTLTRRTLVSVAPAAIVAATISTQAGSHPDAALLALREPYERTRAAMDVASVPHDHAETRYYAMKQAEPAMAERSLRKASGLVAAERVYHQAMCKNQHVIDRVIEEPARTTEGLIFKARISNREDNANPDLVASIVADLVAMGGAHA